MKILISNDDGVHADGINYLMKALSRKHDVIMVAPERERSSCGHGLTLGEPVRVREVEDRIYSCSGTPADCILFALDIHYKDKRPDLIISGINHGANLGQDRFYSGTVAAAREGVFRGVPSIATSLAFKNKHETKHFEDAANYLAKLVDKNIQECIPFMHLLNINIPNIPAEEIVTTVITTPGYQIYSEEVIERTDHRGESYYWLGGTYQGHKDIPDSDCNAVAAKKISVTLEDLTGFAHASSELLESLALKIKG